MFKRQQLLINGNSTMKRSRLLPKKHLYLVLDDWDEGFSIHKIDPGTLQDTATDLEQVGFPEPAVLRLGAPELTLAALGSNIFVATNPRCGQTPTLVYNTETGGLTIGPRLPAPLVGCFHISVAAGDVLYGLSSYHLNVKQQHSFEVLSAAPTRDKQLWSRKPSMNWSWKSVPSPPPLDRDDFITSYVLHPDGHTIVMSVHDMHDLSLAKGTYSFDTKHCEWRWHGEWVLPFQGQGFFDSDLDAWVGLHQDGYICTCQVISRSSTSTMQPDWKMSKDKLFCSESKRHLGATLTYMGETRFCLVKCVVDEQVKPECAFGDRDGCVLSLVMFGLKYSHKGDLQTKIHSTTSTLVSKHLVSFAPVAFWM